MLALCNLANGRPACPEASALDAHRPALLNGVIACLLCVSFAFHHALDPGVIRDRAINEGLASPDFSGYWRLFDTYWVPTSFSPTTMYRLDAVILLLFLVKMTRYFQLIKVCDVYCYMCRYFGSRRAN